MQKDLILLTGATSHVGFRILREALSQGYRVRAVVRSAAKAEQIKNNGVLNPMGEEDDLSFSIVPNFLAPDAFTACLVDGQVKYIIHVASPTPTPVAGEEGKAEDLDSVFVQSAVAMVLNLFEAAKQSNSVKRIVVTSSMSAIIPLSAWSESPERPYKAKDRVPMLSPPYPNLVVAYVASKVAALQRAEEWIAAEKGAVDFDVVHFMPTFVIGRDDLCTSTTGSFATGTNRMVMNHALGLVDPQSTARPNTIAHVDDVAMVHVAALDTGRIEGNRSFVVGTTGRDGMRWDQANEIIAREFGDWVEKGVFPNTGVCGSVITDIDNGETERVFGFKHKGWDEGVIGVVEHYLEVLEREH